MARKPRISSPKDPTNDISGKGRPRRDIDWSLFEQLCSIQCTRSELASFLKVDQDTMIIAAKKFYKNEDFSEIYKKFSDTGKCSLRRFQFVQAKSKPNMAIWLGKQWLGQKDNPDEIIKEAIIHGIKSGLREILEEQRSSLSRKSEVETKQSIQDS